MKTRFWSEKNKTIMRKHNDFWFSTQVLFFEKRCGGEFWVICTDFHLKWFVPEPFRDQKPFWRIGRKIDPRWTKSQIVTKTVAVRTLKLSTSAFCTVFRDESNREGPIWPNPHIWQVQNFQFFAIFSLRKLKMAAKGQVRFLFNFDSVIVTTYS